jgi:hypothetical protein
MAKFQQNINILWYFQIYLNFYIENLAFILPFSLFESLAFFEFAYGQIWPFHFLGPGNPFSEGGCTEQDAY